jgi:hypothetical protein
MKHGARSTSDRRGSPLQTSAPASL